MSTPRTRLNDETRFWLKVERSAGCWLWTATIHRSGYGIFRANGRQVYAHRFAYALHFGSVPDGLEVDHVCHNEDDSCQGGSECLHRRCVNPAHLEAVTHRENGRRGKSAFGINARKTHCPRDHAYDEANTIIERGARICRACREAKRPAGVTPAARTHCPQGHPYSEENTYRSPEGYRKCRTCRRDERRRRHAQAR